VQAKKQGDTYANGVALRKHTRDATTAACGEASATSVEPKGCSACGLLTHLRPTYGLCKFNKRRLLLEKQANEAAAAGLLTNVSGKLPASSLILPT